MCFGQAYFITLQLDPSMRSVGNSSAPTANKNCLVHGVDQGFHNWLLYSGQLSQMMNVKIFQQGEGPVTNLPIHTDIFIHVLYIYAAYLKYKACRMYIILPLLEQRRRFFFHVWPVSVKRYGQYCLGRVESPIFFCMFFLHTWESGGDSPYDQGKVWDMLWHYVEPLKWSSAATIVWTL